jgi:hypothetical protein
MKQLSLWVWIALAFWCSAAFADSTNARSDPASAAPQLALHPSARYHLTAPLIFNAREMAKPCGAIRDVFGVKVATIWDGPLVPPSGDKRWEEMHLPPDIYWMMINGDPARDRNSFLPAHPRR